jgi:hypothetical protein
MESGTNMESNVLHWICLKVIVLLKGEFVSQYLQESKLNQVFLYDFTILRGDAANQDALNGASVEHFEDLKAHEKSFQPPEGKRHCHALFTMVLMCVDHASDVDTKELEALDMFHNSPIDVDGGMLGLPFPVVHDQLFRLVDVVGCLIVFSDQA